MSKSAVRKIRCLGHAAERDAFVSLLQDLGVLEFVDFHQAHPEEDLSPFAGKGESAARDAESRLADLEYLVEYLGRSAEKPGSARRVEVTPEEVGVIEGEDMTPLATRCRDFERRQGQLAAELTQLDSLAKSLEPWRGLPIPLGGLRDTARTRVWVGLLPPLREEELARRIREASIPCHFEILESAAADAAVVVALGEDAVRVQEILREIEFTDASFPGLEATAAEETEKLAERRRAIEAERAEIVEESRRLSRESLPRALIAADLARDRADRAKAPASFAETTSAFLAEGWIRRRDLDRLREAARARFRTVSILEIEPEQGDEPPIELDNPKLIEPFELVTDLYGRPQPKELDPTPLFAPFFAVFFALCLTDAGYGLMLATMTGLGLWKMKLTPGARRLAKLLNRAGLLTIGVGIITGGYFGISVKPLESESPIVRFAQSLVLFDPMLDPLIFFALSLACGVIHVSLGFAMKIRMAWRGGNRFWGTIETLPWLVVTPCLGAIMIQYVLPPDRPLPDVVVGTAASVIWPWGLLGVFLLAPGATKNPIQRVLSGFGSVYGVVGVFGDILSYARLLALGLASAVIAGVINQVGGMLGSVPIVGFVLMAALIVVCHVAFMAVSCLGGFVHTSRLTFVEFFSKFYTGGGRPFAPFRKNRQYILISGEEEVRR